MNLEMNIQKAERDRDEFKTFGDDLKAQQKKLYEIIDQHSSEMEIKMQILREYEQKATLQTEALDTFQRELDDSKTQNAQCAHSLEQAKQAFEVKQREAAKLQKERDELRIQVKNSDKGQPAMSLGGLVSAG